MDYFYGGGGNNNPDFIYRFKVKDIPPDMYRWCAEYPLKGPFERWHIQHPKEGNSPIITFESRKAALMFSIAYSEYIIKDLTYSFAKSIHEPFN